MKFSELVIFHNEQKGKCLSTSHTMTMIEFRNMFYALIGLYSVLTIEINGDQVKVTIPFNQ